MTNGPCSVADEGADKAGLAGTGLTAHQQHSGRSVVCPLDGPREPGEFHVTIHEPADTDLRHRHPVSRLAGTPAGTDAVAPAWRQRRPVRSLATWGYDLSRRIMRTPRTRP